MKHTRTKIARMAAAIDSPEGRIYFAGDSVRKALPHNLREVRRPTSQSLPIGAYEPRWFMYRMSQLFSWPRLPPALSRLIDCRLTDAQKIAIAFVHKVLHE